MDAKTRKRFEKQVLCHLDLVYRMAHTLSHDPHEAEDLVQDTFLRAQRAFNRFDLREYGAKPWLLKILHNVFFTTRGRAAKGPSLLDDASFDEFAAEIEGEDLPTFEHGRLNWENFDQELKHAMLSLAPEYRSVIVLWALADLRYKEIAEVMDCALGTVMSRLYRARLLLNQKLAEYARQRGIRLRTEGEPIEEESR